MQTQVPSEPDSQSSSMPSYKNILNEIAKHLYERKAFLLKRALFVVWPFAVIGAAVYLFSIGIQSGWLGSNNDIIYYSIGLGIAVFFALLYYWIFSIMLAIEKRIWIDAHFDGQHLLPEQSWKVARSFFWPSIGLGVFIFIKYYLSALVILMALSAVGFAVLVNNIFGVDSGRITQISIISIMTVGILTALYFYYVRVKLRFLWFILLDRYGAENFSLRNIVQEMKELNAVQKTESFKKALAVQFGTDALNAVVTAIVRELTTAVGALGYGMGQGGMQRFGAVLGVFSVATRAFGEEASKQLTSYGRIVAFYLLYRQARQIKYGEGKIQNQYYERK